MSTCSSRRWASTDLADRKIATLSGGQRRRLDVAVGIVGRPELLFLDEPTAGFDPQAEREFHDIVHRLAQSEGTTILLTTHDLDEAEKLADRVLILAGGRIVADDTVDGLSPTGSKASPRCCGASTATRHSEEVGDATAFVRTLFEKHGERVAELEVRRASLEDAYIALVQQHEAGHGDAAARLFTEVAR